MDNTMKSVAFHNLGCKVNGYEMDYMQQNLQERGYIVVPFDTKADIYIINTCSVTNMADRKSRQMIHRAKKMNPDAVVVAVGCYVQTSTEEVLQDLSIDIAIGNNRKKDLVEIIEEYLRRSEQEGESFTIEEKKSFSERNIIDINHTDEYEDMQLSHTAEHTRAFLKVQDGCNQFCSYCIIPYARGRIRYLAMEEILKEVRELTANGYQEIVLTGIHLSSYGMEKGNDFTKSRLGELIRAVNAVEGVRRIRLGSLEPRIITEEFAKELSQCEKLCPHFHLSLQSGCDSVLQRMNRKYTTGEYYEKVEILRKFFDKPAITTDVIVGFPQETEEEFMQTVEFLKKIRFYETHIFKYSKRKGTPAAIMQGQIPEEVKSVRSDRLSELHTQNSHAFRESYIGKQVEYLLEEEMVIDGVRYQTGYTREYIRIALKTREDLSGIIQKGVIREFLKPDILLVFSS